MGTTSSTGHKPTSMLGARRGMQDNVGHETWTDIDVGREAWDAGQRRVHRMTYGARQHQMRRRVIVAIVGQRASNGWAAERRCDQGDEWAMVVDERHRVVDGGRAMAIERRWPRVW
ncbi:hypothetical protein GUJ93_ZPchr0006g42173 [Zizania palustris]|uniref:Uncharacterized protein n=1 Tax=Zizania palustris TaxID=103762 RepID=A0A8J5VLH2_ZIZPA|nr:hypothetical protein GUJ93_ZPchr0006g42173 [Zizania palustris]